MRYLLVLVLLFVVSCGKKEVAKVENSKITVITSNFALFDFSRIVGGEKADVTLLLPPGVEAHSYEPTPKDIIKVNNSDLFVSLGYNLEPWVDKIIKGTTLDSTKLVCVANGVKLLPHHHDLEANEDEHHDDGDKHGEMDPHIWLDPIRAITIVENIKDGYIRVDPSDSIYFTNNADTLISKLNKLHNEFIETFKKVNSKEIVYAGHFAFGYFADRYGLTFISPYSGFSPNAEPSPSKIANLIDRIKSDSVKTIFYEELIEPRIAKTISSETGVKMVLLHGIHNVSSKELQSSFSYLKGMEDNRRKLLEGLSN